MPTRIMLRIFTIIVLCFVSVEATASPEARQLLTDGQYEQARQVALSADTVEGLNLAAEVMAAEIMLMRVDDAKDHAKDAIDLVEGSLDRDPNNIEALFHRALHMGFRTRSSGAFAIMTKGLIGKTRKAIETFEAAAPGDARADALYGAWHLGIVRAAGDGRFGASLEEGIARYDRAVAARPEDIIVLSNYAFSLIVMEDAALLPRARELLSKVDMTEPAGATEAETKARMLSLLEVIDDPAALRGRAEGLLNTEETRN